MFTKRTKLSLLMSAVFVLTACQNSQNQKQTTNHASPTFQNHLSNNQQLSAKTLMQQTMLHRFDKSYDYQKTTQYQTALLYDKNDVENQDVSVFLTLIQAFNSRYDKYNDEKYESRPERQACESNFGKQYNQAIKAQSKGNSTTEQTNAELDKIYQEYDACLQDLPPLPKADVTDGNDISDNNEKQCQAEFDKNLEKNSDKAFELFLECLTKAQETANEKASKEISENNDLSDNTTDKNTLATQKSFDSIADNSKIVYKKMDENGNVIEPNKENSDYTTINSIIENTPSVYQSTLKTATEKLKELDKNNKKNLPTDSSETDSDGKVSKSNFAKILANMRLTPQQIEVINQAYLTPKTIQYMGSYDSKTGQFSTVVEENSETTYTQAYKRIPMILDINEMSVVFEPDVALPFVSLMFDKELPDVSGKSVKFTLPDELRQNIPLSMIKDSFIKAMGLAFGDIDSEKFNELVLDDYAKSIHASRVVKVNLTSHDVGFMIGRGLKYFVKDLKQMSEQHPEYIKDNENFKVTLESLENFNKVYRAEDLAKLAQLVETIIPLSFNSFNYYYFDQHNQLIGYRRINDYRSGLLNAKAQSITTNQFSYDTDNRKTTHRYYQPDPKDIVDGNALLKDYYDDKKRTAEAQDARFGYLYDIEAPTDDSVNTDKLDTDNVEANVEIENGDVIMPEQQRY